MKQLLILSGKGGTGKPLPLLLLFPSLRGARLQIVMLMRQICIWLWILKMNLKNQLF